MNQEDCLQVKRDVKKANNPRSLVISPNLEALLEHEERLRGYLALSAPLSHSLDVPSPVVSSVPPETSPGLPPPPRGPRRTRSLRAATPGSAAIQVNSHTLPARGIDEFVHITRSDTVNPSIIAVGSTSSSTSNPYINPAPSLEDVLQDDPLTAASSRPPLSTVNSLAKTRKENQTDIISLPVNLGFQIGPRGETQSVPWSSARVAIPTQPSPALPQPQSKSSPFPRADKFLTIDKGTVNISSVKSDRPSISQRLPFSGTPQTPKLRDRAQSRSKLPRLKEKSQSQSEEMDQIIEVGIGNCPITTSVNNAWHGRPLISHTPRSSASALSDSTHGPASSTDGEPRISISSTIYPSSSSYSHSPSFYNPHGTHESFPPPTHRESFIEIFTPSKAQFTIADRAMLSTPEHVFDPNYQISTSSKPPLEHSQSPIPTLPKPLFGKSTKAGKSRQSPPRGSPPDRSLYEEYHPSLPPTTNFLDLAERADLIKKSRKLARVFGETPGAEAMAQQESGRSGHLASSSYIPPLKARHQLTPSDVVDKSSLRQRRMSERSPTDPQFLTFSNRRHSAPLTPDDVSFLSIVSPNNGSHKFQEPERAPLNDSEPPDHHGTSRTGASSRTSFIDLSEGESPNHDPSSSKIAKKKRNVRRPATPSNQSLFENMTPEEQAEEERRRKRERLAKLHRFLGSRVPANLVLGFSDLETSLPPPQATTGSAEVEDTTCKAWLRRRRSSSAVALPSTWSDDLDRMKEELNNREKAINVRRAQKMEKVFGIAPPQTLYHTRHSPSPSVPTTPSAVIQSNTFFGQSLPETTASQRNVNRSSYTKTARKNSRPGTSESSKQLLSKEPGPSGYSDVTRQSDKPTGSNSPVYQHYQHSLLSLNDILDRDDKESLVELHQYLNGGESVASTLQEFSRAIERRISNASYKSERRRSLPARTSMISLASEYTIASPKPEVTDFQLRRRRAAKLTQFFGVDYRELIMDVLEGIESGLEHERTGGTLHAEEVEDLLERLRNIKIKPHGL